MIISSRVRCVLAAIGLWSGLAAVAAENDPVAVNAGADQQYARQKYGAKGTAPRAESYLLAEGNSFGGMMSDSSLEHARFQDIARTIAPDLALNRYFPAKDRNRADLLIVVHWGMTSIDRNHEDIQNLLKDAKDTFDKSSFIGDDVAAMGAVGGSGGKQAGPVDNGQLLGFGSALQDAHYKALGLPWGGSKSLSQISEETFGEDISGSNPLGGSSERYFVILEAFDFSSIKGAKKGSKAKLLWSVHYSTTSVGTSFLSALTTMSRVAASYFGRNSGGLVLNAQNVPEGFVRIGEPRTVDDGARK
ncbi:MAG TPA: hypothetical protein VGG37_08200 [Opitutaceae bacterium]|jgi:hypothetical protein